MAFYKVSMWLRYRGGKREMGPINQRRGFSIEVMGGPAIRILKPNTEAFQWIMAPLQSGMCIEKEIKHIKVCWKCGCIRSRARWFDISWKKTFPDAQICQLVTKTNSWVYMGNLEVAPYTRHEHHLADRLFLTRKICDIFLFFPFFLREDG